MDKHIFPGWEIIDKIGEGGFSKVYKIKKCDIGGTDFFSALKVIEIPQTREEYNSYLADGYDTESLTKIFNAQAQNIIREFELMHEFRGVTNIVSFEDHLIVKKEDGIGWRILIRMELLETLPSWYSSNSFTDDDVCRLGIDICRALKRCAKKNIIHRDIKPQNIFANDFGDFKLGDFGVAKVMEQASRATKIGTYSYMAPEVFNNEPYSFESDIYSLGLTLYWLLNERRLPFLPLPPEVPTPSDNTDAQQRRLSGETIPAPKYGSEALKAAVLKACAFNPRDRYPSAAEFERALSAVITNGEVCKSETGSKTRTKSIFAPPSNSEEYELSDVIATPPKTFNVSGNTDGKSVPTERVTPAPTEEQPKKPSEKPKIDPEYIHEEIHESQKFDQKTKKSGKGKIIAVAFGLIAIIALSVLLLPSLFEKKAKNTDDEDEKTSVYTSEKISLDSSDEIVSETSSAVSLYTGETESVEESSTPAIEYSQGLDYTLLTNGTYEVYNIGSCTDKEIYIPAEINGKPITSIGNDAFFKCQNITSVIIPDSVTKIGNDAFEGCTALKSVKIPDSVISIGTGAFYECSALKSIIIPDSVTSIGTDTFGFCASLSSVTLPKSIELIDSYAFYSCEALTSITIPENVSELGWDVFECCTNLKDIYCKTSSKPYKWKDTWMGDCKATVHWEQ